MADQGPEQTITGTLAAAQLRLSELSKRKPTRFDLRPSEQEMAELADELGLGALRKLRFGGELRPLRKADWQLDATVGATLVQPCVVTLAPVRTRIDQDIARRYLADWHPPEGAEVEMPEDTGSEPVPETLDLRAVLAEEIALAMPLYPRAEGAELDQKVFTAPGKTPMTDDDAKPFAGLANLKLIRNGDKE